MITNEIKSVKKNNCVMNNDADNREGMISRFEVEPTSLLDAIERVGIFSNESEFSNESLSAIDTELNYLAKRLSITPKQAFLLSVCIEDDFNSMSVSDYAQKLDISNARAISLMKDLTTLVHLRLLSESHGSYSVPNNVLKLLANNEDYKSPQVTGLGTVEILTYVNSLVNKAENDLLDNEELQEEIMWIIKANPECPFVQALNKLQITAYSSVLIVLILSLALCGSGVDRVRLKAIMQYLDDRVEANGLRLAISKGRHELIKKGVVKLCRKDEVDSPNYLTLSKGGRKLLLTGVKIKSRKKEEQKELVEENESIEETFLKVIKVDNIARKTLFYNQEENKLVHQLNKFFEQDNYNAIVERMEQNNFRSAFTCLFYGGSGTGKTETVYQLAKSTQRDILIVDVPLIKDKWVGNSEKNIKSVFDQYRDLSKKSERTPILLFNEADAIFGKRMTGIEHSVDQMINTMQNIILQEMENLNGILIATTNLTDNFDAAFDRRFLYKIKFDRPKVEARVHIWNAMIPSLNAEDTTALAEKYDFSGGQIENVARKYFINNILYGESEEARMESLFDICDSEIIESESNHRRVGY